MMGYVRLFCVVSLSYYWVICYVDHFDLQKYMSDLLHWRPKKHRTNTYKYHLQVVRNHRTEVITAGWPGSHPTLQVLTETYIDQNYHDYESLLPTWNILNNERRKCEMTLFFWWFSYQSMVALENNRAHNAHFCQLVDISFVYVGHHSFLGLLSPCFFSSNLFRDLAMPHVLEHTLASKVVICCPSCRWKQMVTQVSVLVLQQCIDVNVYRKPCVYP
jgi:hypothetical protein